MKIDCASKLRSFFETSLACHLLLGRDQEVLAYNKNIASLLKRLHNAEVYTGMKVSEVLKDKALVSSAVITAKL